MNHTHIGDNGNIYYGKCYYDYKDSTFVHDSGFMSDKTCVHQCDLPIPPRAVLRIAHQKYSKFSHKANIINAEIADIIRMRDAIHVLLDTPIPELSDPKTAASYFRDLVIPEHYRSRYNLALANGQVKIIPKDQSRDALYHGAGLKYC